MRNICKKAAVYLLCLAMLFGGRAEWMGWAVAVKGASLPISRIDADQILDARYQWQAKFLKGRTAAREIHCDNIYAEQFLKGPRGDWGSEATCGVASLPEGDKTFSAEEAPGCYYSDVGQIELEDGSVRTIDLKMQVTASYGGKSRYDYRTPSLTTTNPQYMPSGGELSNITYSWKKGMGRPCVSFMKNTIGLRVYCVDGVDVTMTYLDHQTGQPLAVSGHGTLSDIDGQQMVAFPEGCKIRQVYLLKESEGHLNIGDNCITSEKTSLPSGSRRGDITYFFDNTNSVKIHFDYGQSLKTMTANYEKSLAQAGGSKEKLAEKMKNIYYGSNGETLMGEYQGEEWVTSHASFSYTSKVVGRFVQEPSQNLAKKIGPAGCDWETAENTVKEAPYWVKGQENFDYLLRYELKPAVLSEFTLEDVLSEGLVIEGEHSVTIYDKNGKEVTGLFDISIENGRKITCAASKNAMEESLFSDNQVYTFRIRVHRGKLSDLTFEEDNYTFLVPNYGTLRMRYEKPDGEIQEQTYVSNPVWAGGRITPALLVEKRASRYEWQVGELVDYTVKVTQGKQNAWAQNLVISDTDIPDSLVLQDGFYVEESTPTEHFVLAKEGENGWKCTGPLLKYDESVVIHFRCLATEASNGSEWQNYVYAKAENDVNEVTGEPMAPAFAREEVWVNSPSLSVEKETPRFEWQVGEQVEYTITAANKKSGTLARDVVISDEFLPEGLELIGGAEGIRIEGVPKEVGVPVRDGVTGMNLSHRETVEVQTETSQRGFLIRMNYLPGPAVVQIHFSCLVTGNPQGETPEEMNAPANGRRPCNEVRIQAENANPAENGDKEEIYVNTASLFVDKQADHYEWQVGEDVLYTVLVENRYPGTIARNLVVKDMEIPVGLTLKEGEDSVSAEGIPAMIIQPVKGEPGEEAAEEKQVEWELTRAENGWQLTVSDLPYGNPVQIRFLCTANQAGNGREAVNTATVGADNGSLRQDEAKVYINTAVLNLEKRVLNPYGPGQTQDKQDGRLESEFRVGEEVFYQVRVENIQPGSIARDLVIADTKLPSYLELCEISEIQTEGIPTQIQEPAEVTEDVPNEINPQYYQEMRTKEVTAFLEAKDGGWMLFISDLPDSMPVTITYRCLVTEEANGKEILNYARAWAKNGEAVEDFGKIWVNTPNLAVTKRADKASYLVGDTQTYTINVTQTETGCVARSVVLEDVIHTQGAKLSKSTIVLLNQDGQEIAGESAVRDDAFAVSAGKNLVKEGCYLVWDAKEGKEYEQEGWNPLGEIRERQISLEYAVELTDTNLAGQLVENTARVNSMEGYPAETTAKTPVYAPALRIHKESDKKEYQVGEVVYYHIRVEQIREQAKAHQVWIEDICQDSGMELIPESILAAKNQQRLENGEISLTEQGFHLETGEDLGDTQYFDVYYQMVAKEPYLSGKQVINTVKTAGNNTTVEEDTAEILVHDICPVLEIEKTSDQEQYQPGETGTYEVKVTQVRGGAVARNVILKDELQSEGARILPRTIVVKNNHGVIWSDAEIQYHYGLEGEDVIGYTVFTGKDLKENEFFTVCYEAAYSGEKKAREVVNAARATADNMAEAGISGDAPVTVADGIRAHKKSEAPNGSLVKKGDIITYTITVENMSDEAKNILIKDKIPEYTRLISTGLFSESGEKERGQQMTLEGEDYLGFYIANLAPGESCIRGFQVQVEEPGETELIVNAAQVRTTKTAENEVTEDTYRSGEFRYTNETVHFVDTLWVSTLHHVDIFPETENPSEKETEGDGKTKVTSSPKPTGYPSDKGDDGNSYANNSQKGTVGVNTGDSSPVGIYLMIGVISLWGIIMLFIRKKRRNKKKNRRKTVR